MGKKRRRDEEEGEAEGEAPQPSADLIGDTKKTKQKGVVHVQDLSDKKLQEREAELQETLRKARLDQGNLRGDPPAVYRAEQAYGEVRREIERRRFKK